MAQTQPPRAALRPVLNSAIGRSRPALAKVEPVELKGLAVSLGSSLGSSRLLTSTKPGADPQRHVPPAASWSLPSLTHAPPLEANSASLGPRWEPDSRETQPPRPAPASSPGGTLFLEEQPQGFFKREMCYRREKARTENPGRRP